MTSASWIFFNGSCSAFKSRSALSLSVFAKIQVSLFHEHKNRVLKSEWLSLAVEKLTFNFSHSKFINFWGLKWVLWVNMQGYPCSCVAVPGAWAWEMVIVPPRIAVGITYTQYFCMVLLIMSSYLFQS